MGFQKTRKSDKGGETLRSLVTGRWLSQTPLFPIVLSRKGNTRGGVEMLVTHVQPAAGDSA